MPEGDTLHRAAQKIRVLEGQAVRVETPHPRAAVLGVAPRLDGKRLGRVEAVGKNLLLTFEGGQVLRSHLRMRGRWRVLSVEKRPTGKPWLILRGNRYQAVLWNGPVLELGRQRALNQIRRLGPDILDDPLDLNEVLERLRRADPQREIGEVLLDQRIVAGIGNMWRAETLFRARTSPWRLLSDMSDDKFRSLLTEVARMMRNPLAPKFVYRRAGLPCRQCGAAIESRLQGDLGRTAYWCPRCQPSGQVAASGSGGTSSCVATRRLDNRSTQEGTVHASA